MRRSTEDILPEGMVPGKGEYEKYCELYKNPEFSLVDRIENFDVNSLEAKDVLRIFERSRLEKNDPMLVYVHYQHLTYELTDHETLFRNKFTESGYGRLRSAFIACFRAKVCFDYASGRYTITNEALELIKEKEAKDREEKKAEKKIARLIENDPNYWRHPFWYELKGAEKKVFDRYLRDALQYYKGPCLAARKLECLREGLKMNQKDFAKLIDYPVSKYPDFAKGIIDDYSLFDMRSMTFDSDHLNWFMRLIMSTKANPFWLTDDSEEEDWADADLTLTKDSDDWPTPMFADSEMILKWYEGMQKLMQIVSQIKEGKYEKQ